MKKAAIITIHVGQNFGSNLQTIATYEVIKQMGFSPFVVNYIPKRVARKYYWKEALFSPIKLCWRLLYAPLYYINLVIYERFQEKYCKLSIPFGDDDNFRECCPKADVYITGSDQVWNSIHNQGLNERYFFQGISDSSYIISYASSFGVEKLSENDYDVIKTYLARYQHISVREESARLIVESMGYKADVLLDPTFMLNREDWKKYMSPILYNKPYLLLYIPYNVKDKSLLYKQARAIADKLNLKILTFSWNFKSEKLADKTIRFANPGDFLSLMYYADFIITNSFHGTAFSINLNKQFVVYMPSGFGTRINSILNLCGLQNRLMSDFFDPVLLKNKIDYNKVNFILENERQKSIDYLTKALQ